MSISLYLLASYYSDYFVFCFTNNYILGSFQQIKYNEQISIAIFLFATRPYLYFTARPFRLDIFVIYRIRSPQNF